MLNAKHNAKMILHKVTKTLARLGDLSRAKRLSDERKKEIASLGEKARAESLAAAKNLKENFNYVDAMSALQTSPPQVKRIKSFNGRLPGIRKKPKK